MTTPKYNFPIVILDEDTPSLMLEETMETYIKHHKLPSFAISYDLETFINKTTNEKGETKNILDDFSTIIIAPPASAIQEFSLEAGLVFDSNYPSNCVRIIQDVHDAKDTLKHNIIIGTMLPPEMGLTATTGEYLRMIFFKDLFSGVDNVDITKQKFLSHATIAAAIVNFELEYENAEKSFNELFGETGLSLDRDLLNEQILMAVSEKAFMPNQQKIIDELVEEIKSKI